MALFGIQSPQFRMSFFMKGRGEVPMSPHRLMSMSFEEKYRGTSSLTMRLNNSDGALWYVQPFLTKNAKLEVEFGYPGRMRGPLEFLSTGLPTGSYELELKAKLNEKKKEKNKNEGKRSRAFPNSAVTEVVETLAAEFGYTGSALDIDFDFEKHEQITQASETDLEFLHKLGRLSGRHFWIDEKGFHFKLPSIDAKPVTIFRKAKHAFAPGDIVDWKPDKVATRVPNKVTLRARDPLTRTTISHTVNFNDKDMPVLSGTPIVDDNDGTEFVDRAFFATDQSVLHEASSLMREIKLGAVKMTLTVFGDPLIRPRTTVYISGIADPVDGLWYARSATHDLGDGYFTRMLLGREGHKKSTKPKSDKEPPGDTYEYGGQRYRVIPQQSA